MFFLAFWLVDLLKSAEQSASAAAFLRVYLFLLFDQRIENTGWSGRANGRCY